jgi:DNA-binding PadR family transcriptional regulator
MVRKSLGEFEQLVLLACLRLGEGAYTVSIMKEIEDRTGRAASHAAVYVALRRLEERGLVTSKLGSATAARGGRPKRLVEVLPEAVSMLEAARDDLMSMWQGLNVASEKGTGG